MAQKPIPKPKPKIWISGLGFFAWILDDFGSGWNQNVSPEKLSWKAAMDLWSPAPGPKRVCQILPLHIGNIHQCPRVFFRTDWLSRLEGDLWYEIYKSCWHLEWKHVLVVVQYHVFEPIGVRHSKANFENVDTPAFSAFLSTLMKYHCISWAYEIHRGILFSPKLPWRNKGWKSYSLTWW